MTDLVDHQLIAQVARELVSDMAPQELPLFRANSEAYFKNPEQALAGQPAKDDMLGFGAGEATVFLTPVVLAVATEVVKFVTEEVKKSAQAEGSALVGDAVKAMFKKLRPPEKEKKTPPPLTAEQLAQVRAIALKKARQLKLSEDRARILADSVVGSLATARR
jgi:hypothetical protein